MRKKYMRFLNMKEIAKRMNKLGIKSLTELARRSGSCLSGIHGIMNKGYTNILIATDIAEALGCNVNDISSTDDIFGRVELRQAWCTYEKPTE